MNSKLKFVIILSLLVLAIAAGVYAYNRLSAQYAAPAAPVASSSRPATQSAASDTDRTAAPDFNAVDFEGNKIQLTDFIGKPIVLNFWASWCGPCRLEMPEFQAAFEDLGDEVTFMMVNLTDGDRETPDTVLNFLIEEGYTFPVYLDTEQSAAYAYGISAIPMTVFIDAQGYVTGVARGTINANLLHEQINFLLENDI